MSISAVVFTIKILLIHLAGTYLRYFSFREQIDEPSTRKFFKNVVLISILLIPVYYNLYTSTSMLTATYKIMLMVGWIPFQLLFMLTIRNQKLAHVFVFSMFMVWTFIIHSLSCIAIATFFNDREEHVVIQAEELFYLIFFLLFLPLAKYVFAALLPAFAKFTRPLPRIYLAFLPLIMTTGYLTMISDATLWHSWEERISRLVLPVAFFMTYHYIIATSNRLYEQKHLQHTANIMQQELLYLEEARLLAIDNRKKLKKQLSNLISDYDKLRELISTGKIKEAQAYISEQEQIISSTAITSYTDYSIINAAISIYLQRAHTTGINTIQKINLPRNMNTDENDLAVLLSNLLENALFATSKNNGQKQITMILQHNGAQCVLEIANTFNSHLYLGEDGLPKTNSSGHGIGMLSLKNFVKKYNGYVDFSQKDGWVRLTMYWEDVPL
ncbi:MAG: GHKL domain-containing protein [Anaerovibrio sp.]|uniref:GHKL domain-containing protein n=1 Tax=Anaerovibrio sp. TaxID=1872532 RepID=UPI0025E1C7F5|nr:GHKL domain-containing protein [Anaerovibrio sp.]MCR5176992.1 GHKL domain-containing protein [Anaerovibrio sp.]